jgi:hemoglobin/transferrin/lactoferrin receptor protein
VSQPASRALGPGTPARRKSKQKTLRLGAVMSVAYARARALLLGVSSIALMTGVLPAAAQQAIYLDPITVLATKTTEKTTDSLAAVSVVGLETLERTLPSKPSDILFGIPGVSFQERADDPGTAINIRGLQDFGRVNVVIDGARQNFQRTGHNADGVFYLDPEMIGGAEVVRGPVANIFGSGAIGGVVSFKTKDVDDVLRPGEKWGIETRGEIGSNKMQGAGSVFAAVRVNPKFDFLVGTVERSKQNYKDADGTEIQNSGSSNWSGIAKATIRPVDGHQIKFGFTSFDSRYNTGQSPSSIYSTDVTNNVATARWLYSRPDDKLFDFDGSAYWTSTETDQTKIAGTGNAASGFSGNTRNFTIDTVGADAHNTTRFDTGDFRHALTYGGDSFRDKVNTSGFGTVFTPSGERTVSGGFVQLKTNYSSWLEVIGAARYDSYSLSGGGYNSDGSRVSPKITVGITPVSWVTPYVTYAEGYRAPAITETLVTGIHPVFPMFDLLPNPLLTPEVGKNKEAGVNFRFDSLFTQNDALRIKGNVYQNDVYDYIEMTALSNGDTAVGGTTCTNSAFAPGVGLCQQYQNIPHARLRGFELESSYDAGAWFAGLNYGHVRGRNVETDQPLAKIAPDAVTTTLGARFLDRKLTLAVRWQAVSGKDANDIPKDSQGRLIFPQTSSYNLVNLNATYQATPDILASFAVENLLNTEYTRYMTSYPNSTGSGTPIGFPQPGITFKGALKVRFGDSFFKKG